MYRSALVSVSGGTLSQLTMQDGMYIVITCEGGRIVRRQMTEGGKVFGARQCGYGDAYFEFPFATMQVLGEEIIYESR